MRYGGEGSPAMEGITLLMVVLRQQGPVCVCVCVRAEQKSRQKRVEMEEVTTKEPACV